MAAERVDLPAAFLHEKKDSIAICYTFNFFYPTRFAYFSVKDNTVSADCLFSLRLTRTHLNATVFVLVASLIFVLGKNANQVLPKNQQVEQISLYFFACYGKIKLLKVVS